MNNNVIKLKSFDQIGKCIDELKANKVIVLDVSDLSQIEKEKTIHFVTGATYALEGEEVVSEGIHTITLSDTYWWTYSEYTQFEEINCPLTNVQERFDVVEKLTQGNLIILDVSQLPSDDARTAFDYVAGALYALDGEIEKIKDSFYKCTPLKTVIKGSAKEDCKIIEENRIKIKELMNEKTEEAFETVKVLYEESISLLEKNKLQSPVALTYGMILLENNCYKEAIEVFDRFYKNLRTNGKTDNSLYKDVMRLLAFAYKAEGDDEKLEQFYVGMISAAEKEKEFNHLPFLYNSLGYFYLVNKRSSDAKDILKKCAKMIENQKITDKVIITITNNNLCHAYKNIGRFGKAISIIDETITNIEGEEIFDTILGMKRTKAEIYSTQGKYDKSIKIYEEVLDGYKSDLDKNRKLYTTACGTMANIYAEIKGKEDMAEKWYLEAIGNYKENDLDSDLAIYHNNLGALYIHQKKYEDAKKSLSTALDVYAKLKKDPIDYAESILITQEHMADLAKLIEKEAKNV